MPQPLVVGMTPGIIAADNYTIRITALSPTDGSVVTGVKLSASAILATNIADTPFTSDAAGPFTLLPGDAGS